MGLIAFDLDTNETIIASNAIKKEKGKYVCPFCHNNGNDVPVYLRKTNGEKTFVSYEVRDHIQGCNFPTSQEYQNAYSPVFDRYILLDRIEMPASEKKLENSSHGNVSNSKLHHSKRPTLKWLYNVCIANDNSYEFAEKCTVENSSLKQSTLRYWYEKDKTLYPLLIIGTIKTFNRNTLNLKLAIGNYHILVIFSKDTVFSKFIDDCKKSNGQTVGTTIYLYGQLNFTEKIHSVTIISSKQIDIVP